MARTLSASPIQVGMLLAYKAAAETALEYPVGSTVAEWCEALAASLAVSYEGKNGRSIDTDMERYEALQALKARRPWARIALAFEREREASAAIVLAGGRVVTAEPTAEAE